jgi:hypothetical protein
MKNGLGGKHWEGRVEDVRKGEWVPDQGTSDTDMGLLEEFRAIRTAQGVVFLW